MNVESIRKKLRGRNTNYQLPTSQAPVCARTHEAIPPDNLPLRSDIPRATPTEMTRDIDQVFAAAGRGPSELAAWVMRRETAYFDGPGRMWTFRAICYAACRDWMAWARRVA